MFILVRLKGHQGFSPGPRGVTYSGSTFPNTELLGVPGAESPLGQKFPAQNVSPLPIGLSADGEACSRPIWGKGEEQEKREQTDQGPEKSSTLKLAFPLSGEEPRIPGAARRV